MDILLYIGIMLLLIACLLYGRRRYIVVTSGTTLTVSRPFSHLVDSSANYRLW